MPTGFRETIADTLFILKESVKSFQKNNNFGISASLAYYGFFALIPLLLLVIYILGSYITSSQAAIEGIENVTSKLLPQFNKTITREIYSISQLRGMWGALSIIALFWSITPLTGGLRNAFSTIFKVDRKIPFIRAKLVDAAVVLIILILFVSLVVSEIFYSITVSAFFKKLPFLFNVIDIIAPLFITMLFMTFFYFIFSPVKMRFTYLLTGALITAMLWSVMRPLFSLFLTFNPRYGVAFGSLKAVFIIFVWVYYAFSVILFGAEVMTNVIKKNALLLKGVFLNSQLSDKKHKRLMKKFGESYDKGEVIFSEGDADNNMFFILSGAVNIIKNEQVLKVMRQGEYFGEMSMLIQSPRTATAAVAESDTHLLTISEDNFGVILREEPKVILSVLKEMALRLKATNEYLQ